VVVEMERVAVIKMISEIPKRCVQSVEVVL
jgi:hypothetical protein